MVGLAGLVGVEFTGVLPLPVVGTETGTATGVDTGTETPDPGIIVGDPTRPPSPPARAAKADTVGLDEGPGATIATGAEVGLGDLVRGGLGLPPLFPILTSSSLLA